MFEIVNDKRTRYYTRVNCCLAPTRCKRRIKQYNIRLHEYLHVVLCTANLMFGKNNIMTKSFTGSMRPNTLFYCLHNVSLYDCRRYCKCTAFRIIIPTRYCLQPSVHMYLPDPYTRVFYRHSA